MSGCSANNRSREAGKKRTVIGSESWRFDIRLNSFNADVQDLTAQTRLLPRLTRAAGENWRAGTDRVIRDYDMARNTQRFASEIRKRWDAIARANQNQQSG